MSYFTRLLRTKSEPSTPDTSAMEQTLRQAKKENSLEVKRFTEATQKQQLAAKFARTVITQVLNRADNIKATRDASIKK